MFATHFAGRRPQPARQASRNRFRPGVEPCEARQMLAGGITAEVVGTILRVNGTP